jgi:hypothetical protein
MRMATASTISLTAVDWIANQSERRVASFLMLSQRLGPVAAPAAASTGSSVADRSDMAFLVGKPRRAGAAA